MNGIKENTKIKFREKETRKIQQKSINRLCVCVRLLWNFYFIIFSLSPISLMHRENFYHTHSIDPGTTTTKTIFQFFHNFFYPKSIICCWGLAFHTRSVSYPIFQFVSRVNFFIDKICQYSTLFLSCALCTTGCLCLDTVHWKIPFNFFSLFSCSVNPSTNISRRCPYGLLLSVEHD